MVATSNEGTDTEEDQMPLVKLSSSSLSLLLIASGDFVQTNHIYILVPTRYENKHIVAVQNEHLY